jgi:hypothetical protein
MMFTRMSVLAVKEKTTCVLRGAITGIAASAISFFLLRPAAELCAVLIRREWPDAWFSGMVVWYADFFAVGLSIAIAVVVGRLTFKRCHS